MPYEAGYDSIAEGYNRFVRERSSIHLVSIPALVGLCGSGARVLDLACGQGVLARALAASGRFVAGVDISAELLRIAMDEERANPLGIEYVRDDACSLTALPTGSFDGVASNLALTDIDDLPAALRSVARVLRPGGWFSFATLHPCFVSPPVAEPQADGQVIRYFAECRWRPDDTGRLLARLGWHHRTVGTLLNLVLDAGFRLDRFAEPQAFPPHDDALEPVSGVADVMLVRSRLPSRATAPLGRGPIGERPRPLVPTGRRTDVRVPDGGDSPGCHLSSGLESRKVHLPEEPIWHLGMRDVA